MKPSELGIKYDKIAQWWHDQHDQSSYSVSQFERAIGFTSGEGKALDIGCGVGGRFFAYYKIMVSRLLVLMYREKWLSWLAAITQNTNSYIKIFTHGKQKRSSILSLPGIAFFTCHLLCKSLLLLSCASFWRKVAY